MRGLSWRAARLAKVRRETDTACTLRMEVPGWPAHVAGQHVDVRLTAEDGYSIQRTASRCGGGTDQLHLLGGQVVRS
ncbi:hypothetical protein ACTWPT_07685 [Nonomuraea sp. 3N208]|uniref:hypothetical protein n=1 Tax=Nonomuraea sp. 3N208 TaxID=3457421 RepID=UPI003FCCD475